MNTKKISILGLASLALLTASCTSVHSSFVKELNFVTQAQREPHSVELFTQKPQKSALRIGKISTNGNGFADFDDLIKEAKEKAAKLGGDFILAENSGIDKETIFSPGYSTYQSNAYASYGTHSGYGNRIASGYSYGPSVTTIERPWSVFSVWVYTPSQLGVRIDDKSISAFHLNSDAEKVGIKIGDILIGIDGYDVLDEALISHLMKVHPGDKVKISVLRDSKKKEFQITALPN